MCVKSFVFFLLNSENIPNFVPDIQPTSLTKIIANEQSTVGAEKTIDGILKQKH